MNDVFMPPYTVLAQDAVSCRIAIVLTADAPCFDGHFPDFPVLAGVVQLHWVRRFAAHLLAVDGAFAGMEQIKFSGIVRPGEGLELQLNLDAANLCITFAYEMAGRKVSSGRLRVLSA